MKPLTAHDCDLRDFPFMPLDVVRLRDSDFAAVTDGEEFRAGILLWCASWHQVPAASLPDDDVILSQLAGFGRVVKEWKKVRPGALRGWVKCEDGRLYHPVIASKAREAYEAKLLQRWKTECARLKKHCQRHGTAFNPPTFEAWLSSNCPEGQNENVPRDKCEVSQSSPSGNAIQGTGIGTETEIRNNHSVETAAQQPPAVVEATVPAALPDREIVVCKLLRENGIDATPAQCRNAKAAEAMQQCDADWLAAVATAKQRKPPDERIGLGYLLPIMTEMRKPAQARASPSHSDRMTQQANTIAALTGTPPGTSHERTFDSTARIVN